METNGNLGWIAKFICFVQLCVLGVVDARAEEFPARPIQFLVGLASGSVTDTSARALAKVASKYLEKPLLVVNIPGAAQTLAMNKLASSAPDGYTIALLTTTYKSLIVHMQKIPFDPAALKPLLGYAEFRQLLFVRADSPYSKLEDLIAYGQKNPGAIKFGHPGTGTAPYMQGVLFFKSANIQATDVPYKGSSDYTNAVLGGHLLAAIIDISGISHLIRAGTVKPVIAFVNQPITNFPEIPTSQAKGYVGLAALNPLVAIAIHKDTPADRIEKLHDALKRTVEDPEFAKVLDDMGLKGGYISPKVVEETISKAEEMGVPLLKGAKLYVQ